MSRMPAAPPSNDILANLLNNTDKDELALSRAFCLFVPDGENNYSNIVYSIKYNNYQNAGLYFGNLLGKRILADIDIDYTGIIPIPLHKARKRERGYNQSELISKGIAEIINKPVLTNIIDRKFYTQTQTKLDSKQRQENVSDIFEINKNAKIKSDDIFLLADDVLTTGSTLNSCAIKLLQAGAKRIDCAAIMRAQ